MSIKQRSYLLTMAFNAWMMGFLPIPQVSSVSSHSPISPGTLSPLPGWFLPPNTLYLLTPTYCLSLKSHCLWEAFPNPSSPGVLSMEHQEFSASSTITVTGWILSYLFCKNWPQGGSGSCYYALEGAFLVDCYCQYDMVTKICLGVRKHGSESLLFIY